MVPGFNEWVHKLTSYPLIENENLEWLMENLEVDPQILRIIGLLDDKRLNDRWATAFKNSNSSEWQIYLTAYPLLRGYSMQKFDSFGLAFLFDGISTFMGYL